MLTKFKSYNKLGGAHLRELMLYHSPPQPIPDQWDFDRRSFLDANDDDEDSKQYSIIHHLYMEQFL